MIDRRTLLKASGALIVAFSLPLDHIAAKMDAGAKTVSADRVDGFLAIASDGQVTAYSGKVDLGTGVRTALTQIVAEELDVPINRVTIVEATLRSHQTRARPAAASRSRTAACNCGGRRPLRARPCYAEPRLGC